MTFFYNDGHGRLQAWTTDTGQHPGKAKMGKWACGSPENATLKEVGLSQFDPRLQKVIVKIKVGLLHFMDHNIVMTVMIR